MDSNNGISNSKSENLQKSWHFSNFEDASRKAGQMLTK